LHCYDDHDLTNTSDDEATIDVEESLNVNACPLYVAKCDLVGICDEMSFKKGDLLCIVGCDYEVCCYSAINKSRCDSGNIYRWDMLEECG